MTADGVTADKPSAHAAERLAQEIRRLRKEAGLSQPELARMIGYTRQYVSMAERAGKNIPSQELVKALDKTLAAKGMLIELRRHAKQEQVTLRQGGLLSKVSDEAAQLIEPDEIDPVNRKQFLSGLIGTLAVPSLAGVAGASISKIDATDVRRYRINLSSLYALDDHYGAGEEVYGLTIRSMRFLLRALEHASYSASVGVELRSVAGQLMEHAGWLAFDAGFDHDARYWWLEALHSARMASDVDTETVVLASMSLAASRSGRGREAVDLARAALRAITPRSTPRLRSVLAAREALGHARLGDRAATADALRHADSELQHGERDDDPMWLDFWGPSDLASHVTQTARYLGDLSVAERSARDALAAVDPTIHPRNHAIYQARYAATLVEQRRIDEAIPVLTSAAFAAAQFGSQRLVVDIQTIVGALVCNHGDMKDVRELSTWASDNLVSRTNWPAVY